jgi:hypothetical protein
VLRAAVPRAEATFGRSHPLTLRAKTVLADAVVLHDVPGALAIIEEVVPAALGGLPATADEAVAGLKEKAYVLAKLNRAEDSYAALRESIALAEKHFGPLDERTIMALGSLANTYGRFGDSPNQVVVAADAVERARRAFGARRPHETLIMMERFYADALWNERPGDAVPIYRTVLADQQRLDAAETTRVRDAKLQLGYALLLSGRLEEGLPLVREAVALERQQNAADSDDRRGFGMALTLALLLAQRTDEGLQEQERLAALVARLGTEPHRSAGLRRIRWARLHALAGQSERAQALAAEAEAMATPREETNRVQAELTRAFDARMQLRHSEALARLERTLREHRLEKMSARIQGEVAAELGTVRLELGDLAAAEEELARCRALFTRAQVEVSIPVTPCLVGTARLQLRAGHPAEAERLLLPLSASWERVNPDGPGRGEVLHWLARAEEELGKRGPAHHDAGLAKDLLRRAKVPALLRLAGAKVGSTSPRTPADAAP